MHSHFVSPRKPLVVSIDGRQVLCYRLVLNTEAPEGSPARKMVDLLWTRVQKPQFVIVGEPAQGVPVYLVSEVLMANHPGWNADTVDPGPMMGHLVASTLEDERRTANIDTPYEDGNLKLTATELPTFIGERKAWALSESSWSRTGMSAEDISQVCFLLHALKPSRNRSLVTSDIDLSDVDGARRSVRRRALEAYPEYAEDLSAFIDGARPAAEFDAFLDTLV